jgi:hypothetical protein
MIAGHWAPRIATAVALCISAASARGDINNSGNCVVIVQGNFNATNLDCSTPLPTYPPDPRFNHVWQTPNLGIGFEQDGKWVPIFTTPDGKKVIVDLAPRPFVIWVPEDHWTDPNSDMPALQVSISWNDAGLDRSSSDLFQPGTGMADTGRGSGQLILTNPTDQGPGHNYIVGHRFNRQMPHWRGIFISVIDTVPSRANLITAATQAYGVFMMAEDDMTPKGKPKRTVPIDEAPRDNIVLNFAPRS